VSVVTERTEFSRTFSTQGS